jgi:hypothetical protein
VATYAVVTWRGVPASVEASDGAETVTLTLSDRFQQLIDAAAMQLGLHEAEAYMEQWDRTPTAERPGTAREVAEAVAAELEERFPEFIQCAYGMR